MADRGTASGAAAAPSGAADDVHPDSQSGSKGSRREEPAPHQPCSYWKQGVWVGLFFPGGKIVTIIGIVFVGVNIFVGVVV